MATKKKNGRLGRREFLKKVGAGGALASSAQNFRCFWSAPSGWGGFSQTVTAASQAVEVETLEGSMSVASLALGRNGKAAWKKVSARLGRQVLAATLREEEKLRVVAFDREVRIVPGQALSAVLRV